MDAARRKKVVLRWTLFITTTVTAYRLWRWYALGALVPVTAWRDSPDGWPHEIGFAISPLWDILVAAALTASVALIVTSPSLNDSRDSEETVLQKVVWVLSMIPLSGVTLGLFFGIFNGLTAGVTMGFVSAAAMVALFIAPLIAIFAFVRWLVLSAPLRAFVCWLMANESSKTDP